MQETTGIEFEIDDEDCSDNEDDDVTPSVTRHMAGACAVREGEQGAFQIGSLCGLMSELGTLLEQLGVEPSVHAVDELRRKYSENEDHCDDDPHIQCLCHAWLTGHDALAHNVPLWVMK